MNTASLRGCLIFSAWILIFVATPSVAQSPSGTAVGNAVKINEFTNNELGRRLWSLSFEKKLSPEARKKLFYFDHWNTKGIINSKYSIKNVNYSFYDDAMVYKVATDSLFLFDKESVDHFTLNHRKFKRYYLGYNIGNAYLEGLFESSDGKIKLLKRQYISTAKGDVDPLMMKKTSVKIARHKEYYLIKDGGHPLRIRLSKKDILKRFPEQKDRLSSNANLQNLSFRKEKDVLKLLRDLNDGTSKNMK